MFYRIKLDKVKELRNGRTNIYISQITGYAREYVSNILTGKRNLEDNGVKKFLIPVCEDVTKLKERLDKEGLDKTIKYFFDIL